MGPKPGFGIARAFRISEIGFKQKGRTVQKIIFIQNLCADDFRKNISVNEECYTYFLS